MTARHLRLVPLFAAALTTSLVACDPPTDTEDTDVVDTDTDDTDITVDDPADLPLLGTWADNWGGLHEISAETWVSGTSTFAIDSVDLDAGTIVAQNGADNAWNPDLWSRFDYVADGEDFWFCQAAYDAGSAEAAADAAASDASDPATTGCGGFPWTRLSEPLPIRGSYTDDFGGTHVIDEASWTSGDSLFQVVEYDNEGQYVIAQNDAENEWFPGLWSRFDWTEDGGDLYFCQIAYDAADQQAALDAGPADATDPSASGCGGFAWSKLTPQ